MSKSLKWLLILGGMAAIVFAGVIGIGIYKVYSILSGGGEREVPDELKNARVLKGEGVLEKTAFFKLEAKSTVGIISEGYSGKKNEKERQRVLQGRIAESIDAFDDLKVINGNLVAAAAFGGFEFGPDGKLKRRVFFEPIEQKAKIGPFNSSTFRQGVDDLRVVSLTSEKYGFVSHNSVDGMTVFSSNGDTLWTYGRSEVDLSVLVASEEELDKKYEKSVLVLESAVGELDGDGKSEFIVAMKNEGIKVFAQDGNILWSYRDKFPRNPLVVEDLDGDGKNELIQIGGSVFDATGKKQGELKNIDSNSAIVVAEKEKKRTVQFCEIRNNETNCIDESGKAVLNGPAPLSELELSGPTPTPIDIGNRVSVPLDNSISIYAPRAVRVRLFADQPAYLAVVGEFIGLPRANLYVYSADGKLVFHELLPEGAKTIAVLPSDGEVDSFVVGGSSTIWKYTAR